VNLHRTSLAAALAFAVLSAGLPQMGTRGGTLGPIAAEAQVAGFRVVGGAVVDEHSVPVVGATVFLKDLKSKNIRSFTSVEHGRFRFASVSMTEDHELWAEKDGKKSAVKTISTWEARKEMEVELKLK